MTERWDRAFLSLATDFAQKLSKDPNTQVGAVLVGLGHEVISMGYNGFPVGIADTPERLNDRDMKNRMVSHAERNAIYLAARKGIKTQGATIYMAATDSSGLIWGGAPCTQCTIAVIQAGIRQVVTAPIKNVPSRWHDDLHFARQMLDEAGIIYREVEPHNSFDQGYFW